MRQRRNDVARHDRRLYAERCAAHLITQLRQRRARRVALYLEYGSELSTAPLIVMLQQHRIDVFVPKLRDGRMRFFKLQRGTPLRPNRFGIPEPAGTPRVTVNRLDVMVMPLTAFDAQGHRLGTGGGYYDRLLEGTRLRRRPWRVGYAYAFQQVPELPVEPWDIHLHAICTERGIRHIDPKPESP